MIGSVDKGTLKGLPILSPKGIADHDPHTCVGTTITTCDTGDADAVVIHRSDNTRHVRAVGVVSNIGILVGEVISVDIVLVLALTGTRIDPDILSQVLMLIVDTTIDDSHDDGGVSGLLLPRLEEVEISALERLESRACIVVVPLLGEVGVVEGHHILLVTLGVKAVGSQREEYRLIHRPVERHLLHQIHSGEISDLRSRAECGTLTGILVEDNVVPEVEPRPAHTLLIGRLHDKDRAHLAGTDTPEEIAHGRIGTP